MTARGMAMGGAMIGLFAFLVCISAVRWWRPLDAAQAEALLEQERTVVPQGFEELARGAERPAADGTLRVSFEVPAMACARALVVGEVAHGLRNTSLADADGDLLVHGGMYRGADLGWCVGDAPTTLTLAVEVSAEEAVPGPIHYWILAGNPPVGMHWSQLVRGHESQEAWREVWTTRERLLAEQRILARASDGPPLFERDVGPETALALPLSATTTWAAHLAGTLDAPDSSYLPRLVDAEGETRGRHRPVVSPGTRPHRPLLVLDPRDLPVDGDVPCVRVRFDRLSTEVARVRRFAIPRPGARALSTAIVRGADRRCPDDGVAVYAVPEADVADWRVTVTADGLPADPQPRQPTERLEGPVLAAPYVAAKEGCDAGDGEACLTLAEHHAVGRYATRDLDRAIELASSVCAVAARACGVVGDYEQMAGRPERAVAMWERGCEGGDGWACAQLGEARRLGEGTAFDPAGARVAYVKARELEVPRVASHIRALDELELTAP